MCMWTHNFSGQPTSQPAGPEAPAAAVAINLPRVYLCYLQLQKRSFIVPAIISHKTATIVPFRLLCKILFAVTKSKFDSRVGSPGSGWLWLALECCFLSPPLPCHMINALTGGPSEIRSWLWSSCSRSTSCMMRVASSLWAIVYSTASAGDNKLRVERGEVSLGNPKLHFN